MGNVGTYTLSMNAAQLHGDMFLNYALTFLVNMQSAPFLWVVVNRDRIQWIALVRIYFGITLATLGMYNVGVSPVISVCSIY